jgi:type I restriction enzyme S subunit
MKDQKKIPQLRFAEFEGEWKRKKIGDISKVKNGFAFKGEFFGERGPYIILTPGNFDVGGGFRYQGSKEKYYTSTDVLEDYILKKGDLLTVMTEQAVGLIGRGLIVPESGLFLHNQRLGLFEVGKKVQKEFLFHYMKTHSLSLKFSKSAAGTKVRHTSVKLIEGIDLSIPSLSEQIRIATFFNSVDKRITLLQKKKAQLEQYKKGVMQKIFSQELRFKDEQGKDFPEWKEFEFGDIYSFVSTNSFSREKLNYHSGKVKNIHYGDIHTKFKSLFRIDKEEVPFVNSDVDLSRISDNNYVQEGDLVIADASENYEDIGKTVEIVNLNGDKVLAGLHTFLAKQQNGDIVEGFGGYMMQSQDVRMQIKRIAQGTKVLGISTGRLGKITLRVPNAPEQQKIANFLSAIDQKIEQVDAQVESTKQFKKGLLQQMFV